MSYVYYEINSVLMFHHRTNAVGKLTESRKEREFSNADFNAIEQIEKCDRIKSNIRLNRQKFNKSVEEFGTDKSLDLDDS